MSDEEKPEPESPETQDADPDEKLWLTEDEVLSRAFPDPRDRAIINLPESRRIINRLLRGEEINLV